jgi:ribosomal protein L40E
LWRKEADKIPTAIVKSTSYLGHNSGQPVLRLEQSRTIELGFGALFVAMFASIPIMVGGDVGPAMAIWAVATAGGFIIGHRIRRDVCVGRGCGAKLPADAERCPRCGGTLVGRMQRKENLLEAEERLGINQDDLDIDVGESSGSSVELPVARVSRDARVDTGATDTRIR